MIKSLKNILICFLCVFPIFGILADDPLEDLTAVSAILMDQSTGRILYERNADIHYPPASMTKLVTLYLAYQAMEEGQFKPDQVVEVTAEGSSFSRPPRSSLMLLEEGQRVDYLSLMRGVAISSGNDAAYQLAQLLGGSWPLFVDQMNFLMEEKGLENMRFVDPDGWSEDNQVTAREYAQFCSIYIEDFPRALEELHSVPRFSYPKPENFPLEGGQILWTREKQNTNILLGKVVGVDGLKTGYIDESGFNFAATAKRGQTRLISVVMGIFTDNYSQGIQQRADESETLLEYGFSHWQTLDAPVKDWTQRIWLGAENEVSLGVEDIPLLTLSHAERARLIHLVKFSDCPVTPVLKGQDMGVIQWYLDGELLEERELVAMESIERGNLWEQTIDFFPMIFYKIFHRREG